MIEMAETTPIEILINLRFQPQGIPETIQALDQVLSRINQLRQAGVPISTVTSGLGQIRNQATRTAQSIQQVASSGTIFWVTFDRLGITLAMTKEQFDSFQEAVTAADRATSRVPESVEFAREKVAQFAQAMGISNQRAAELVAAYTPLTEASRKVGRSTDALSSRYASLRRYMRAFQVQLGEVGFAFFRVGYQIYWVAIGMIFYSLSLYRAQQAQLSLRRSALSLIEAELRLRDQEERLQEIIREYGPASREAIRASRDLALMRMKQRLQEEMLRMQIRRTAIAQMTANLTLIPIYVNTLAVLWNLFAAVTAKSTAEMADAAKAPTKVAAEWSVIGALKAHLATLKSYITLKTIAIGLTTFGIGALAAWATTSIVAWQTERMVNEEMAKLNQEMEQYRTELGMSMNETIGAAGAFSQLGREVKENTELAKELERQYTGNSLCDALLITRDAAFSLYSELSRLRDIRLTYSVSLLPLVSLRREVEKIESEIQTMNNRQIVIETVQRIRQELIPARIPEIEDKVQTVRQIAILASIPEIGDQTQYIRQVLQRIEIPEVEDQIQYIRQVLISARIPSIQDQVQRIVQRVVPTRIPSVNDQTQLIFQELIPISIPEVEDQVQNITQRLSPVTIPEIETQVQTIRQELIPVEIPEIEEQEQIIRQQLVPIQIPRIQDQIQYIRQEVISARIPRVEDQIQYIKQELVPISIPRIEEQEIQREIEQKVRIEYVFPREALTTRQPSVTVNIRFGNVEVKEKRDIEAIANSIYYTFQRNIREVRYV